MKLLVLFVCTTVCVSMVIATDRRCDEKEDGEDCMCGRLKIGQCVDGVCDCDNISRRKRSYCSSDWDCGSSCSCSNKQCCCPWHNWC